MRLCRESERWERSFHRTGSSVVGAMWIMINVHYAPSKSCCWSLLVAIYVLSSCFAFFSGLLQRRWTSRKNLFSLESLFFIRFGLGCVRKEKRTTKNDDDPVSRKISALRNILLPLSFRSSTHCSSGLLRKYHCPTNRPGPDSNSGTTLNHFSLARSDVDGRRCTVARLSRTYRGA